MLHTQKGYLLSCELEEAGKHNCVVPKEHQVSCKRGWLVSGRRGWSRHKPSESPAVPGQLLAAPSSVPMPCAQSALPFWEQIPIYKGALLILTPLLLIPR